MLKSLVTLCAADITKLTKRGGVILTKKDADEKVDLEDMHTTLKKAGDKSLTLYGGDPSRNLSNWIKSEFNEEMANGQVSIKKSGTCRRVFGFASL